MRRIMRAWGGAMLAALLWSGIAAAVDFKIATIAPEGSEWMQSIRAAATDIRRQTDGRVVVKIYGGGVMGNERQVLRKIRIGQLQGGAFTANGLAERYANIVLYGLPLTFESQAEVDYVRQRMDAQLLKGLEDAGFVSFGMAGGGFARIFANRPVSTTADMRGQKIWVPEGDRVSTAAMQALRLSPVALPVTDVLTGLQTGLLDIVAAPPVGVIALQWHTRVKYMTLVPLMYTMGLMAVDARAFAKLDPADQAVFRKVMGEVYREMDRKTVVDDAAAVDALAASGVQIVEASAEDLRSWRGAAAGANRDLGQQGVYDPALRQQLEGYLHEFRQQSARAAADTAGAR
ncbi:MAG: TRAP transporter substrate-binding protein DctP [Gammaproteobacteria bacterium]|nr:TRAP transporter substrate-binding protein DctP [Gammaproteobacteria bacterium]